MSDSQSLIETGEYSGGVKDCSGVGVLDLGFHEDG